MKFPSIDGLILVQIAFFVVVVKTWNSDGFSKKLAEELNSTLFQLRFLQKDIFKNNIVFWNHNTTLYGKCYFVIQNKVKLWNIPAI